MNFHVYLKIEGVTLKVMHCVLIIFCRALQKYSYFDMLTNIRDQTGNRFDFLGLWSRYCIWIRLL